MIRFEKHVIFKWSDSRCTYGATDETFANDFIIAMVPGFSFIPFSIVLNRYIRYDSRCSRSRFDLKPVSNSVTVSLSNEWFGRFRCFERGRFGIDLAWALWLLKRSLNEVSV